MSGWSEQEQVLMHDLSSARSLIDDLEKQLAEKEGEIAGLRKERDEALAGLTETKTALLKINDLLAVAEKAARDLR